MAKTLIIDVENKNRVPYLRGILARSLNKAGLSFESAYALASELRQELDGIEEISANGLRKMVVEKLIDRSGHKVVERYQAQISEIPVIMVEDLDGQLIPYSDEYFSRELKIIGLSQDKIHIAVKKMYEHLIKSGLKQIHKNHLGYLVYRCLHQDPAFGPRIAERYLTWVNFSRSGNPLILLIGGTAGCGKSTIATSLANRLGIVRTQSTDMLREVMRMMIPHRLLPVLHESSFNAGKTLPTEHMGEEVDHENMLIAGFRTQAELLSVPCEAVIQRTLTENVSLLLEGVHIEPPLLKKVPENSSAVVVHVMLAVLKQKELKKRIKGRKLMVPERYSKGHQESFDDIWRLQSYLLDEADQADIPIVENQNKEDAMQEIMKIVINRLAEKYSVSPQEVFGKNHEDFLQKKGR